MKDARLDPPAGRGRTTYETAFRPRFYGTPAPRTTCKQRPPYGRAAEAALRAHQGPLTAADLHIYTGRRAWAEARHRARWQPSKPTLVAPLGTDPGVYR